MPAQGDIVVSRTRDGYWHLAFICAGEDPRSPGWIMVKDHDSEWQGLSIREDLLTRPRVLGVASDGQKVAEGWPSGRRLQGVQTAVKRT